MRHKPLEFMPSSSRYHLTSTLDDTDAGILNRYITDLENELKTYRTAVDSFVAVVRRVGGIPDEE